MNLRRVSIAHLRRNALRTAIVLLIVATGGGTAHARITGLQATVDQTRIQVGESITLRIIVQSDGAMPAMPSQPNWDGLTLRSGPSSTENTSIINSRRSVSRIMTYSLIGDTPGVFEIGPSEYVDGARRYTTEPIRITVVPRSENRLPPSLRGEPILPPLSTNGAVAKQLEGAMFVRPGISSLTPYVGEPIVLTYDLYRDPRYPTGQGMVIRTPEFKEMLAEVGQQAQSPSFVSVVIDDRQYQAARLYSVVLTPTRPGEFLIDGFNVRFRLPVNAPSRRRSLFDDFFEPMRHMVEVEARGGALRLNVKPLPEKGKTANFSGTVGAFRLTCGIDQEAATQDDLITLELVIEGRGNVALASVPVFPENPDFELFDRTQETEKVPDETGLTGKKSIEYLLRPKRVGMLTIPEIEYEIFNPERRAYQTLRCPSRQVEIRAGQSVAIAVAGGRGGLQILPEETADKLHYIKNIESLSASAPRTLMEAPLYWIVQIGALLLAAVALMQARRRELSDPAQVRRANAARKLEEKIKRIRRRGSQGGAEESAAALERALRGYAADRFNLSADGMTMDEISESLGREGMEESKVLRLREILTACSEVQYAPSTGSAERFVLWADEAQSILTESSS